MTSELLFAEEVSEITRVPAATLRFWATQTDRGPRSARLGRRRVWRRSEVEAWVEAQFEASATKESA